MGDFEPDYRVSAFIIFPFFIQTQLKFTAVRDRVSHDRRLPFPAFRVGEKRQAAVRSMAGISCEWSYKAHVSALSLSEDGLL